MYSRLINFTQRLPVIVQDRTKRTIEYINLININFIDNYSTEERLIDVCKTLLIPGRSLWRYCKEYITSIKILSGFMWRIWNTITVNKIKMYNICRFYNDDKKFTNKKSPLLLFFLFSNV